MDTLARASQFVAVILSIAMLAVPLSACLTPVGQMSEEEQECCRKMAESCEPSMMPSSHPCCQHSVSHQAVADSKIQRNDFSPAVGAQMIAASPMLRTIPRDNASSFESPPESPPQIVTVLRI
jgi:hypothetical protein